MSKGKGFSKEKDGVKMNDGTEAWLLPSGRYYARAEPSYEDFQSCAYYSLDKDGIPLAKGTCNQCGQTLESKMCGDFQSCACGSFVDTDRWFPERHRYGGNIKSFI